MNLCMHGLVNRKHFCCYIHILKQMENLWLLYLEIAKSLLSASFSERDKSLPFSFMCWRYIQPWSMPLARSKQSSNVHIPAPLHCLVLLYAEWPVLLANSISIGTTGPCVYRSTEVRPTNFPSKPCSFWWILTTAIRLGSSYLGSSCHPVVHHAFLS